MNSKGRITIFVKTQRLLLYLKTFGPPAIVIWTIMPFSLVEASRLPAHSPSQVYDAHGAGCSNTQTEFVNHGLIQWNQSRQKWVWDKKSDSRAQELREPRLSWNATYDSLLSNNKPFEKPIPLGEMVDFLVDVWEQEGMYD